MRVIAGAYRGRPLAAPKGRDTRPTTDRVREALMSVVESRRGLAGTCVLDAFAGSGALGVEAVSRGAAFALFCDKDAAAVAAIRKNAAFLPRDAYRVMRTDVLAHPPFAPPDSALRPFDVVFLDPPYAMAAEKVAGLVVQLEQGGTLADGALICYEHAGADDAVAHGAFDALESAFVLQKRYGDTAIDFFRRNAQ